MTLYSLEEAQYLKDFYSPKVVNQIADKKLALRITSVEIEEIKKDFYDIICKGYFVNNTSIVPKVSIQSIFKSMDLDSPEVALQRRNL
ncbi:hypothetical protein [Flavobacterium muglaense]|uniref:Uncharacterized protein n=1 Tax=Flavobacterium muglaense TaxID=2764716 RepID=A0A923N2G9_9FLAO|nr:hypothetical protein [Flavobacterium muglaense]MBC5839744.1 hypothetical protein [Flavobacterium muglaense]MBC5846271.1 hypothetical protein [Flavobacterium muglaense]